MAKEKMKRWTEEEDAVLVKAVKDNPGNIGKACEAASHILPRSAKACSYRWYATLSKKKPNKKTVAFMSVTSTTATPNRKNFSTRKKAPKGFFKLWNKMLKSLMV